MSRTTQVACLEIVVLLKCIGRGEQNAVIAVLPKKKSPHPPQHARVVVDHKRQVFCFDKDRWSFCTGEASICRAAAQIDSLR